MKKGVVAWAYLIIFLANAAPFFAFDFYGYFFYGNWTEAGGVNLTVKVYDASGNPHVKISEHSSVSDAEGWFNASGIPAPELNYTYEAVLAIPGVVHINEEDYPAVSLSPEEIGALADLMPLEIRLNGEDFQISAQSICKGSKKDPLCYINVTNMSATPHKGRSSSYFYVTANVADPLDTPTVMVNNVLMSLVSGTLYATNSTGTDLRCRKDGQCELVFSATDSLGNMNDSEMVEITIDNEPPSLKNPSKSPPVAKSSRNVQINVTATDSSNISSVYVNNLTMSSCGGDVYTVTANSSALGCASEGACTLRFSAADEIGNTNSALTDTLVIDDTPPEVKEYYAGISAARSDANFMINAQLKDATQIASAKVNGIEMVRAGAGNDYTLYTNGSALGCPEGLCSLQLNATDIAGNSNDSAVLQVMIDDTKPSILSVFSSLDSSGAAISWETDEETSAKVEYWVESSSNSSCAELLNLSVSGSILISPLLPAATYYYNISVCDEAGNCNISGLYNFTTPAPIPEVHKSRTKKHKISVGEGMKKTLISMKPSEKIIFRIGGETHTLTIGKYSDLFVNITIFSTPKLYTLEVNKSLMIDIDQDSHYDLLAEYKGIFRRRLDILFDYINYTLEKDGQQEAPLPELQTQQQEDAPEQPAQEQPYQAAAEPEKETPISLAVLEQAPQKEGASIFIIVSMIVAVLIVIVFAVMFIDDRII